MTAGLWAHHSGPVSLVLSLATMLNVFNAATRAIITTATAKEEKKNASRSDGLQTNGIRFTCLYIPIYLCFMYT